MADAVERLVNLAFFLAHARTPVSAEQIRANVAGYPGDQDYDAFIRMFERDKDALRSAGFAIEAAENAYRLDAAATFASQVELKAADAAALRAVGLALLDDPAFPFAQDLRLALAKLGTGEGLATLENTGAPVVAHIADEDPELQGSLVSMLDEAVSAHKRVTFDYTNAAGEHKHHEVEPYGLFVRDGRWYLVGRDTRIDEQRVYALFRMANAVVNAAKPKTADFAVPDGFTVSSFIAQPFQYGRDEAAPAIVRFSAEHAWRAEALTGGAGELVPNADGSVDWHTTMRDPRRLLRWVVENGPGLTAIEPPELARMLEDSLAKVVALHG